MNESFSVGQLPAEPAPGGLGTRYPFELQVGASGGAGADRHVLLAESEPSYRARPSSRFQTLNPVFGVLTIEFLLEVAQG